MGNQNSGNDAKQFQEEQYQKALALMNEENKFIGEDNPLLQAATIFDHISVYKDSYKKAKECREAYKSIKEDIEYDTYRTKSTKEAKANKKEKILLVLLFFLILGPFVAFALYKFFAF